jgi:AraC family transcriptional regulator
MSYQGRINRVIDHINAHLDEELALDDLARIAAFSPFHFHRVFSACVGEPLGAFIKRLRLDRAALRLLSNPSLSVTEVALDASYSSPAAFARAFKERFGVSASEWRGKEGEALRKCGKADRKDGNAADGANDDPSQQIDWRNVIMQISVQKLPARRLAYYRAFGPYGESSAVAWTALCRWGGPRGVFGPQAPMIGISYDDPTITAPEKLRYDAGVVVGDNVQAEGDIGIQTLPGGDYAVAHYEGPGKGISAAYGKIFGEFMPKGGYQPGDSPSYEVYLNDPKDDHFVMDICVPVKPL